jgi:hypothetical protein
VADYADLDDLANLGAAPDILADVADAKKEATITARSRFADGFLRAVPLVVPDGGLTAFTGDLTWAVVQLSVYDLVTDLYRYQTDKPNEDTLRKRHDDAIQWLQWVADGTVGAPVSSDEEEDSDTVAGAPVVVSNCIRGWTEREAE